MKRTALILMFTGMMILGFAACEPIENGDFEAPMDPPVEPPMME